MRFFHTRLISPSKAHLFAERYATWQQLHRRHGPGRSYPYAWRLPELARPLGQPYANQALHALALDLYCLGRFPEALEALSAQSGADSADESVRLRQYILCLTGHETVLDSGSNLYLKYLCAENLCDAGYLTNQNCNYPALTSLPPEAAPHWQALLNAWAQTRQAQSSDLEPLHRALAALRKSTPSLSAQAEALFAEIQFLQNPRWSVDWLDHALDQVESFSQHHLKARLLFLKAQALAASGELKESIRFKTLAISLAKRQGAQHYLERWAR